VIVSTHFLQVLATDNSLEFWAARLTSFKLLAPLAEDINSAPVLKHSFTEYFS